VLNGVDEDDAVDDGTDAGTGVPHDAQNRARPVNGSPQDEQRLDDDAIEIDDVVGDGLSLAADGIVDDDCGAMETLLTVTDDRTLIDEDDDDGEATEPPFRATGDAFDGIISLGDVALMLFIGVVGDIDDDDNGVVGTVTSNDDDVGDVIVEAVDDGDDNDEVVEDGDVIDVGDNDANDDDDDDCTLPRRGNVDVGDTMVDRLPIDDDCL
jgi:hypothetical protein